MTIHVFDKCVSPCEVILCLSHKTQNQQLTSKESHSLALTEFIRLFSVFQHESVFVQLFYEH